MKHTLDEIPVLHSTIGSFRIVEDVYCPTWKTYPHTGWRRLLIRLRFPERWLKPKRRERVFYTMPAHGLIVCSPENKRFVFDAIDLAALDTAMLNKEQTP